MSQKTFKEALQTAAPNLVIFDDEDPGPAPVGFTQVSFHLAPVAGGVRLSIRLGAEPSRSMVFSSEEDAANFIAAAFAVATS